jgi:hypothetical protein
MGVAKKENSEGGPSEFNPAEPEGEPVRRYLGVVLFGNRGAVGCRHEKRFGFIILGTFY